MNKNRFGVFTTPRTSVDDNHEEIFNHPENFNPTPISDNNRQGIDQSGLPYAVNAPIFVPRSISIDSSQQAENFTIRPPFSILPKSPKKFGETKKSPTKTEQWSVIRQKESKPKTWPSSNTNGANFDEKPPVRSSCSRKKALEGILARQKVLIILRGPPGSGKSYLARNFKNPNGIICNTDEYFMTSENVYQYNPARIEDAHRWNQQRAIRAMENRVTPVIIDNTNCQAWEMAPYVQSGIRNGYEIHFITPETPWAFDAKECSRLNKHGVPYERVVQMIDRFDRNITLRSFTHGNCLRPTKPVVAEIKRNPADGPTDYSHTDQGEFGTSTKAKELKVALVVNDLNSWDDGDSQAWSIENDYIPGRFNQASLPPVQNSTASMDVSLDSLPKKQRSTTNKSSGNQNAKISLKTETFLTASWDLPNDLTGGLLSTIGDKSNPFDAHVLPIVLDDRLVQVCDRQCQVNDKIIALSTCLRRRTSEGDPLLDQDVSYRTALLTNHKLCCDKGIQVDVNPDVSGDHQTPFEMLKSFFPLVPDDDLSHILSTCDGDIEWATNVLLDTGHEIDWRMINQTTESAELNENASNIDSSMSELGENADDQRSEEMPSVDDLQAKLPSMVDDDMFDGESCHLMELSVDMATQLQHLFCRLHDDIPAELLSPQQLKICLPFGLVAQLYQYWLNTQTGYDTSASISNNIYDDEIYAFDEFVSAEELSGAVGSSPRTIQRQMQLDELLARSLLEEDEQNYFAFESSQRPTPGDPTSLSTKLKFQKLIEMFPGVDQVVLNELFKANNYLLEPTMDVICQSFSIPANRKPQPSTSFASVFPTTPTSKRSQPTSVPVEDDDNLQYDQMRRDALEHFHKRKEYFQKAQDAFRRGQKPVASYYAQVGRVYDAKFKDANRLAAQKLLQHRRKNDPQDTLDLHGLHVAEAIAALSEKLKEYDKRTGKCLKVITGKGKHSDGRGPKIKPAVVAFLKQRKFCFSETGSGLIQILIK